MRLQYLYLIRFHWTRFEGKHDPLQVDALSTIKYRRIPMKLLRQTRRVSAYKKNFRSARTPLTPREHPPRRPRCERVHKNAVDRAHHPPHNVNFTLYNTINTTYLTHPSSLIAHRSSLTPCHPPLPEPHQTPARYTGGCVGG